MGSSINKHRINCVANWICVRCFFHKLKVGVKLLQKNKPGLQDILLSKFSICSHAMQAFMDLPTQKTTTHPSWTVKPSRSRFLFDRTLERWILTLDIKDVFIFIFCGWYIEMVKFMFQKSDIYRKSWNWGKFWPLQMYRWNKMLWCCETWSTDKIVFVSLEL